MISRVACVPRICQSCRQGLLLRRNPILSSARFFHSDIVLQRRNDPPTIQSKARVEALISGKRWEEDKPSENKRRRNSPKSRRVREDELPDWGLTSEQEQAASEQKRASKHRKGPRNTSKSNKNARLNGPRDENGTARPWRSKNKGRAASNNSPNFQEHRNSKSWNKVASKDKSTIEQDQIPERKGGVEDVKDTTSHEEHQTSESKETIVGTEELQNFDCKDNIATKDATILEENRPSRSETVLGHALGAFSESIGFTPKSTISEPEVSKTEHSSPQSLDTSGSSLGATPDSNGANEQDVPKSETPPSQAGETSSNSLGFTAEPQIIEESEGSKSENTSGLASQPKNDFTIAEHDEESMILQDSRGHGKKHFKHQLLQKHSLSIGALGENISALVLPNPDKLKPKSNPQVSLPPDKTVLESELDWKSLIPDDAEALDISVEVGRNIEEFRPKDSSVIKAKDFKRIIRNLVDGFTKEQLATYFRQASQISNTSTNEAPEYPWLFNETQWVPSTPERLGQHSPKQNVAYLILKEGWALDIQEEVESLGAASVTLRPDVFELISNPSTGALESLQSDILDESSNEAIITNEKKNELHIHARKASVRAILSRIDEAVQAMQTQKISVEGADSLNLRKEVLDRLSSITKTSIQYNQQDSKLDIMWLGQGSPAAISKPNPGASNLQVESPADIVFRLLQDRHLHLQGDFEVISSFSKSTTTRMGMFMPYDREVRSLSWRNKIRTWSRYVLPIGKSTTAEPEKLGLSRKSNLLRDTPEFEIDGAETQLAATFGYILHSGAEPSQSKKEAVRRRVLLPVLPHPAAFTEIAGEGESEAPLAKTSSIVLNFIPTQHDSKAPEVRLSLPVNADDNFSDFTMSEESKLYAVSPVQQQDLLFPSESVDARLTQQSVLPLDIAKQLHIQEFFGASEFNLVEGRLRTPSHTQISLPSQWPSADGQPTDGVAYTFAGLEIHQTIDLEWQGYNLRYNSIEAGQHGGTRQELSLQAKQGAEISSGSTDPEKRATFLQLVEGIVTGKFFSWTEGSKAIREIPDEYELDGAQDQDYDDVEGLELLDAEDAWFQWEDESHSGSAEPVSIYEQCDKSLGRGEDLSVVVREALNGGEELQSTSYLNQGETIIRTGEELVDTIEEALASTSEQHLASNSTIAEAEGVLRTTEQLTTMIEEALVEHESPEGADGRIAATSMDEAK